MEHLVRQCLSLLSASGKRLKGDTPLNPRSKGVTPLWTPQNGEWVSSQVGVFAPKRETIHPLFIRGTNALKANSLLADA